MKKFVFIAICVVALSSCTTTFQNGIKGNGKMVTKEITIDDYNNISIGGQFDLVYTIQPNEKPYLRIEIDENLAEYVSIAVRDSILDIKTSTEINPKYYKIYTNSTSLAAISAGGVSNIELKDSIYSENLLISISGVGKIVANNLHCINLDASTSGLADIILEGEAINANMSVSGKGDIEAYNMKIQNADCNVSGIGSINVYASERLSAHVSGIGKIRYKGNPKEKNTSSSGIGSVKEKK